MIGIDLVDLVSKNNEAAIEKWDQRKRGMKIDGWISQSSAI